MAEKTPAKKPNALQQPLQPSSELAAVVGSGQLSRGEVVSKVWDYIKKNNLQNPENKREIVADDFERHQLRSRERFVERYIVAHRDEVAAELRLHGHPVEDKREDAEPQRYEQLTERFHGAISVEVANVIVSPERRRRPRGREPRR